MSLNTWSIIYLGISLATMIAIYFSLFKALTTFKVLIVIFTWLSQICFNLVYGIATNQIGFIALFIMQFFFTAIMLIQYRKATNDTSVVE